MADIGGEEEHAFARAEIAMDNGTSICVAIPLNVVTGTPCMVFHSVMPL